MYALLRAAALPILVVGASACAARSQPSATLNEYRWAFDHGGCDCGPAAYAARSITPNWVDGENLAVYVRERTLHCVSRQVIVTAFGDGDGDLAADMALAKARAAPFVRRLNDLAYRRIDTLAFAGPHLFHPSTVAIICPTDRLPPQSSF